jgi:hypothetical protein
MKRALVLLLLLLPSIALAQGTELTFRCNGISKVANNDDPDYNKEHTIMNLGVAINVQAKTVTGLLQVGLTSTITQIDDTASDFQSPSPKTYPYVFIAGLFDRITGHLTAMSQEAQTQGHATFMNWDLICTPARRLL